MCCNTWLHTSQIIRCIPSSFQVHYLPRKFSSVQIQGLKSSSVDPQQLAEDLPKDNKWHRFLRTNILRKLYLLHPREWWWSIVMSMSVCLSASISPEPHVHVHIAYYHCSVLQRGGTISRGRSNSGSFLPHRQCIVWTISISLAK